MEHANAKLGFMKIMVLVCPAQPLMNSYNVKQQALTLYARLVLPWPMAIQIAHAQLGTIKLEMSVFSAPSFVTPAKMKLDA